MTTDLEVGDGVTYDCGNGGVLKIIGEDGETDLRSRTGADGTFAFYDDLHLDAYNDMVIHVDDDEYHVEATVQHLTGDAVMRFELNSLEPNGKTDVKLSGLKPDSWYRLRFDGVLAACRGGRAHGKTDENGLLYFYEVEIPNA